MKRLAMIACMVAALMIGAVAPSFAAREYSPEIKEYLKNVKKQRKAEDKKEREERKADSNRRLRPYQTLDEIYAEMDTLIAEKPELFSGGTYGRSVEGRDLRWIRLHTGPGDKPQVLISGNIHAQELAGGQMVMALIRTFAEQYDQSCDIKKLADAVDVYFIPVLNPDGMAKAATQQPKYGITGFVRKNVNKVDLNRNFPYPADAPDKLKNEAGSPQKYSETHRGVTPLSEPETKALIAFIDRHQFLLSLGYHTSGGLILYAPGTYPDPFPDTELMRQIALAYQTRQFDKYKVQPGIDLYPTLGDLDDYLYHHYGILAFTVEVGKNNEDQATGVVNGTFSPIFWMYNVSRLDQEKANNVPGALAMIQYAVTVHKDPSVLQWQPPQDLWVGEPPPPTEQAMDAVKADKTHPSPVEK